jgi:hypothetical protein
MPPERVPPISSTTTGSEQRAPIQNRRVMSASSGLGPVVERDASRLQRHAADRAGARADLRISGCIGQV